MSNSQATHPQLLATLKELSAEGDALSQLIAVVAALRPGRANDALLATARFTVLCDAIENDTALQLTMRARLLQLFSGRKQVSFFADSGILPNSGFFSELWRRFIQRIFPAITDPAYLRDCINRIFHRRDDYIWLQAVPTALKLRFWQALRMTETREDPALLESLAQMLDASDVLATRIGAMGLEPELIRLYPRIEERDSPFLALTVETHQLSASYRAYLSGGAAPTDDERQLQVLIEQCREVLSRIRARAASVGTSLTLTYLMRRLEQCLHRLELIVQMLGTRHQITNVGDDDLPLVELWVNFLGQAIHGEGMRQSIRGHVSRTIGLLALRVTDNASRAGEHYITTSRDEYFWMWRSAMGAGIVVGFMALLKSYSSQAELPPLGYALAYSMNYSFGFMLIHVLHWTLATKQPAMTASTIAGVISEISGRIKDVEKLATLIVDLMRSQFAAIAGNVLIAIPTAMLLSFGIGIMTGAPIMSADKARALLHDLSPIDSLALFHAAIAGVCLFLGGLISGYYDNLAAYERIRERIEHAKWLQTLLGEKRLARLAVYLDNNLGALAGNFFLGIMLALVGTIGFLTGLPIDVRHVTLSSANFGLAMAALDFSVDALVITKCVVGIALIGFINLTVSFALAMWVALRARGVSFDQGGMLVSILFLRLKTDWHQYFWPRRPG